MSFAETVRQKYNLAKKGKFLNVENMIKLAVMYGKNSVSFNDNKEIVNDLLNIEINDNKITWESYDDLTKKHDISFNKQIDDLHSNYYELKLFKMSCMIKERIMEAAKFGNFVIEYMDANNKCSCPEHNNGDVYSINMNDIFRHAIDKLSDEEDFIVTRNHFEDAKYKHVSILWVKSNGEYIIPKTEFSRNVINIYRNVTSHFSTLLLKTVNDVKTQILRCAKSGVNEITIVGIPSNEKNIMMLILQEEGFIIENVPTKIIISWKCFDLNNTSYFRRIVEINYKAAAILKEDMHIKQEKNNDIAPSLINDKYSQLKEQIEKLAMNAECSLIISKYQIDVTYPTIFKNILEMLKNDGFDCNLDKDFNAIISW